MPAVCRNTDTAELKEPAKFITSPGIYRYRHADRVTGKVRAINVSVKEFKDGSTVYGVSDNRNHLLFQSSLFATFSNYQKWIIYVQNGDTIWHYNSDLQESVRLVREEHSGRFLPKDVSYDQLPEVMRKELQ